MLFPQKAKLFRDGRNGGLKIAIVMDRALIKNAKPQKHWISYIKQRISKNKNFVGFISGSTGSGKSYSCLRMGEELDPNFNIDQVVFSGKELMALINSGKLRKGSCIVFEEAGIGMSNKSWQSVTNKMINFLIQTFRHKNFVLILNSPFMDFVDLSTRKLFHAEMQTMSIDMKNKQVRLRPVILQYNARYKKMYYKKLRVVTGKGVIPVATWRVDLPSKELLKNYEKKKNEFTDALNKKIWEELNAVDSDGKKVKELPPVQEEVFKLLKEGKNVEEIAKIRDRNPCVIRECIIRLRHKGYIIKGVTKERSNEILYYKVLAPGQNNSTPAQTPAQTVLNSNRPENLQIPDI